MGEPFLPVPVSALRLPLKTEHPEWYSAYLDLQAAAGFPPRPEGAGSAPPPPSHTLRVSRRKLAELTGLSERQARYLIEYLVEHRLAKILEPPAGPKGMLLQLTPAWYAERRNVRRPGRKSEPPPDLDPLNHPTRTTRRKRKRKKRKNRPTSKSKPQKEIDTAEGGEVSHKVSRFLRAKIAGHSPVDKRSEWLRDGENLLVRFDTVFERSGLRPDHNLVDQQPLSTFVGNRSGSNNSKGSEKGNRVPAGEESSSSPDSPPHTPPLEKTTENTPPKSPPTGKLQQLYKLMISRGSKGHEPPRAERAKQIAVLKRLQDRNGSESVTIAMHGMGELWPWNEGRPWDAWTLEKKFTMAHAAGRMAAEKERRSDEARRQSEITKEELENRAKQRASWWDALEQQFLREDPDLKARIRAQATKALSRQKVTDRARDQVFRATVRKLYAREIGASPP